MSDQFSLFWGGMSFEGRINFVGILEFRFDLQDKKVLCLVVCYCSSMFNFSQDGKSFKQVCVVQWLGELDEVFQGCSFYKFEVSYDMIKNLLQLIFDSQIGNSLYGWILGWISKYWDEDLEYLLFKLGKGMICRFDVIIVQNFNRLLIQDNIKQVVEMKFLFDLYNRE